MATAHPSGGSRQQPPRGSRVIPFGKYLLLERLAVGGMAEVFLAKSFGIEGFEKIIAIKRILPTMAEDEDFIDMFIDEAKIAGHLTHANIVPIYELGKIGESHYIAMEYVWGKDSLQIMNRFRRMRKRPPPAMVAFIGSKILEGLDYAHNKRDRKGNPLKLIHRDVSPQNILVSYEGQVKLIDFGIARAASRTTKTQAGVLKGKFGYMSPEQVRGLPIDHRSDVFAVGTCLHELITGERLFLGESDFTTLEKVRNADVQPPSTVIAGVPQELDDIIMKALSRDPGDRFETAGAFQEALQHFLATQRPPFGTSKLAQWMKTAFAAELDKEKARLDSYGSIGRPSVLGGGGPQAKKARPAADAQPQPSAGAPAPKPTANAKPAAAPAPAPAPAPAAKAPHVEPALDPDLLDDEDELEGESTVVSASPFEQEDGGAEPAEVSPDDVVDLPPEGELHEEATTIFFSADEIDPVEEDDEEEETRNFGALGSPQRSSSPPPAPAASPAPSPQAVAPQLQAPSKPAAAAQPQPAAGMGPSPPPTAPGAASPKAPPGGPGLQPPDAAPPAEHPRQPTPVVPGDQRPAGQKGKGRLVVMMSAAAVVFLAVLAAGGYFLLAGEEHGTIQVQTVPQVAANVIIDGNDEGTTPVTVSDVSPGERLVEIKAEGFETVTKRVQVGANSTAMLDVALTPASAAEDEAAADAEDEAVADAEGEGEESEGKADAKEGEQASDEEKVADAAEADADEADADADAEHKASASDAEERQARARTARRRDRERDRQRDTSDRPQRLRTGGGGGGAGKLVVNSMPWARVFIDGRNTGQDTPVRGLRVPAGTHQLGLKTSDGTMHTFTIEVPAGETVRVVKKL